MATLIRKHGIHSRTINYFMQRAFAISCLATFRVASALESATPNLNLSPNVREKVANMVLAAERRAQHRAAEPRALCKRCIRPPNLCVCAELPTELIETSTQILVLQHPVEFKRKTISTVPLLPLCLRNIQVKVGCSFDVESLSPVRDALERGRKPLLLFPSPKALSLDNPEDVRILGRSLPETERGDLLILLDGTWSQAKNMARDSPSLVKCCQQVQFSLASSSLYGDLRREPEGHCVSTLEACARALVLLEPQNGRASSAAAHLEASLRALVSTQLHWRDALGDAVGKGRHCRGRAQRLRELRRLEVERELFGDAA